MKFWLYVNELSLNGILGHVVKRWVGQGFVIERGSYKNKKQFAWKGRT